MPRRHSCLRENSLRQTRVSALPPAMCHAPPCVMHRGVPPLFRGALLRKMRFVGVYAKNAPLTSEMASFCTPGILFDVGRSMLDVGCSGHMTSRLAVSRMNRNKTRKNRHDFEVGHPVPCDQGRNGNIEHRTSNIEHRTKMGKVPSWGVGQIARGRATASSPSRTTNIQPAVNACGAARRGRRRPTHAMSPVQFVMHPPSCTLLRRVGR